MDWGALDVPAPVYPDNGVGKGLAPLLQNKAFQDMKDFTIKVENTELKVHKMVLIAASHYFKALLEYADAEEKNPNETELKGLNPLAVSNLVDYIYTNQITGTRARPEDLLEAASYLQIPPAVEMAAKFMKDAVDLENCFEYLAIFELYSLTREAAYTKDFIQYKFNDIRKAHALYTKPYDKFLQVVELWGNPESELLATIQRWLSVDEENRKQYENSLLHQVRFALLTPEELQTIKALNVYKQSSGTWTSLVDAAIDYHSMPAHRKVVYPSGQNKVRQDPTPVIISSRDTDDNDSYALQQDGAWRRFMPHTSPDLHEGVAASLVLNDFLIVCQAFSSSQDWHIFDPRSLTWSSMTRMKEPRKDFALAHDGRSLYAMGGSMRQAWEIRSPRVRVRRPKETDSMVKYDFETDSWSDMTTKLPIPCHEQYVCHLSGFIYMTGGFSGRGQCLPRLDRFDPSKEMWEPRAPMFEKRPCFSMNVLTLCGEEFIHIMNDSFMMQYYNPRTDQWSMWCSFSELRSDLMMDITPNHRDDSRVVAHRDTLFLLNFDRECDYPQEDGYVISRDEPAGCVTWKVRRDSRRVTEKLLKNLPLFVDVIHDQHYSGKYIAGVLAFPRALPGGN